MSADPARAMAAASRLTALLDDEAVVGDLLLVGVTLVALVDLHHAALAKPESKPHPDGMPNANLLTLDAAIAARKTPLLRGHTTREAISKDRRRYQARRPGWCATCEAPMIRRAGYCGSDRGGSFVWLRDYSTGELRTVSHCSRHRDWAESLQRDNIREAPDPTAPRGGAPEPYANTGGHLALHFPEIDWPKLWSDLDPRWVAPRERTTAPRPRFELVIGDDERSDDEPAPPLTGGLRLIPSGRVIAP